MFARLVLVSVASLYLTSCTHQPERSAAATLPAAVRVATVDQVTHCQFIQDVHGVSGLYGVFAAKALNKARVAALSQARELGANTVVWLQFNTPHGSTSIDGNAYRCP